MFPVGNVTERKPDEIRNNPRVDEAIRNAKQILFTSRCFGHYHSHPHKQFFEGAANPSNGDVSYASWLKQPYMMMIAISRNALLEKKLYIEYRYSKKCVFSHVRKKGLHDYPEETTSDGEVSYVHGRFKKYEFEIRAFKVVGKDLVSIDLLSSEVEMLMELVANQINIEMLDAHTAYALRKIEYDFRVLKGQNDNKKATTQQNLEYHIKKIKGSK